MAKVQGKFKPYVGRCFELKSYTDLKKYPAIILVMDESKKEVEFIDNAGNATWISKFYLRDKPLESRVFSSADTLTEAMTLIESLRKESEAYHLSFGTGDHNKVVSKLNKECGRILQELRDLGTRMQGIKFAPPVEETPEEEPAPLQSEYERDKQMIAEAAANDNAV